MAERSRLLREYETWFQINKKMLEELEDTESMKVLNVFSSTNHLIGMLMFLMGIGEITKDEFEEMRREIDREFNTKKIYGFDYHMTVETFNVTD